MKQVDEVFRDRLSDHMVTPSPDTWQELESRLSKKNSPVPVLRWAAALLVGVSVAGILWISRPVPAPVFVKATVPPPSKPYVNAQEIKQPAVEVQIAKTVKKKSAPAPAQSTNVEEIVSPVETPVAQVVEAPFSEVAEPASIDPVQPVAAASPRKPIVLVYTLEPVPAPGDAELEKKTSIQRVVTFAENVKHSDPLTEFREIKDELLAINLKKKTKQSDVKN